LRPAKLRRVRLRGRNYDVPSSRLVELVFRPRAGGPVDSLSHRGLGAVGGFARAKMGVRIGVGRMMTEKSVLGAPGVCGTRSAKSSTRASRAHVRIIVSL